MDPVWFFPGPGDLTYGLAIYSGCLSCGNPAGVMLYEIPARSMQHFNAEGAPPWTDYRDSWREVAVPIIGQEQLATALREQTTLNAYQVEEAATCYHGAAFATTEAFFARLADIDKEGQPNGNV